MTDDSAELAAELAARTDAEARMAAALVELEHHPGHVTLAAGISTGITAERWAAASAALRRLWSDFAIYRSILDAARARPAQRHRLLREESIEVARTAVPFAQRGLVGAAEVVEMITVDALAARMDVAFREVGHVVTICDAVQSALFAALLPLADRAHAALTAARDLDPDGVAAADAQLADELADIRRVCARDPLSLADRQVDDVLAPLGEAVDAAAARSAALADTRRTWDIARIELERGLVEVERLGEAARAAQAGFREPAPGPDVCGADPIPALRRRLAALPGLVAWPARTAAVAGLRRDVAAAEAALRIAAADATGLRERHAELRGRFDSYHFKAARLGIVEQTPVLAAGERTRDLLRTRPCDLAAATVALVEYQRLIRDGEQRVNMRAGTS